MNSTKIALLSLAVGVSAPISIFSPTVQAADVATCQEGTSRGVSRGVSRGPSRGKSPCLSLDQNFSLCALTPISGRINSEQPTLYWSISQDISAAQFEITLTPTAPKGSFDFPEPLIDTTQTMSVKKGNQPLSLKDYKVKLETGVEYKWSVSLVCDPSNPSLNVSSTGKFKRVTP